MKNRQTIRPSELTSLIATKRIDGQPFVVTIVGGSASGKTTIAQQLVEELGVGTAEVFSQDWFQLGKDFSARKTSRYKWDDPENFDLPACQDALRQLRLGQPVHFLAFDVVENIRTDEQTVNPKSVVVWEGVYTAFTPELRELSDIIIYVDTPYEMLEDGGVLCTIGWDETFNDELNMLWYQYIPDDIEAKNFEEWRRKRAAVFTSPRNCNLTWLKTNLRVPLQFSTVEEATNIMGHLFGRDAGIEIAKSGRLSWDMSYGVTFNTKEEIAEILKELEACHEK